jgi:hypothetical protein
LITARTINSIAEIERSATGIPNIIALAFLAIVLLIKTFSSMFFSFEK